MTLLIYLHILIQYVNQLRLSTLTDITMTWFSFQVWKSPVFLEVSSLLSSVVKIFYNKDIFGHWLLIYLKM